MSKDAKEQEQGFTVKDRRRFSMDEDGKVKENPENPAATEEKSPDPEPEKAADSTQEKPETAKDFKQCEEKLKDLPPMTFTTLVLSLSTQALISLGDMPDPMGNAEGKNLPLAKQTIDLLGILDEKTKGNLSKDEGQFLKTSLTDLRLRFVNVCKGVKE